MEYIDHDAMELHCFGVGYDEKIRKYLDQLVDVDHSLVLNDDFIQSSLRGEVQQLLGDDQ